MQFVIIFTFPRSSSRLFPISPNSGPERHIPISLEILEVATAALSRLLASVVRAQSKARAVRAVITEPRRAVSIAKRREKEGENWRCAAAHPCRLFRSLLRSTRSCVYARAHLAFPPRTRSEIVPSKFLSPAGKSARRSVVFAAGKRYRTI